MTEQKGKPSLFDTGVSLFVLGILGTIGSAIYGVALPFLLPLSYITAFIALCITMLGLIALTVGWVAKVIGGN